MQRAIETQRLRLASSEVEDRRDAVMKLGWMKRPEASRVAALALNDPSEVVRATATTAVLSLPPEEAAGLLLPLLKDKREFVRQEAAYALGHTRSVSAVGSLIVVLESDKQPGVRGAASVALGQIGDQAAAPALAAALDPNSALSRSTRRKKEDNEFVRRASARSLGQVGSRVGVPALIAVLGDEKASDDLRRESARSLGLIGDASAVPALRAVLTVQDPTLSFLAFEALRKMTASQNSPPPS
jgi:HEAT repeat protein